MVESELHFLIVISVDYSIFLPLFSFDVISNFKSMKANRKRRNSRATGFPKDKKDKQIRWLNAEKIMNTCWKRLKLEAQRVKIRSRDKMVLTFSGYGNTSKSTAPSSGTVMSLVRDLAMCQAASEISVCLCVFVRQMYKSVVLSLPDVSLQQNKEPAWEQTSQEAGSRVYVYVCLEASCHNCGGRAVSSFK